MDNARRQGSVFTLFRAFRFIHFRFLHKCGPVRALQRRRRILALSSGIETMTSRTTPKILSHTPKITDHVLFQRDTHRTVKSTDEFFARRPPSSHGVIRAMSLAKSLRNTPRLSYPPHPPHVLSPLSPPPAPFQHQHVAFAPVLSYSTSDLIVPPSPLRN
jgi:hypothetical protein